MDEPDRIHLRDHVIAADIGAFNSERGQMQRLRFAVEVDLAEPVAGAGDEVDRILSYDVLTGAVATALADRRYDLLETLAEQIAAQVLDHPRAARVTVTVEKLDRVPGALGVTLTRRRARTAANPVQTHPLVLFAGAPFALPGGAVLIVPDAPGLPLPEGGDARRIALLALDQAAWALAGRLGVTVAGTRTELDWAAAEGLAAVWAPARMAADVPDLPAEPKDLAFWLAARMRAQRLDWALPDAAPLPEAPPGMVVPIARLNTPAPGAALRGQDR